ncbi:MAG: putative metal-binding motif-containing protein [Deltaproteobacteria bacterium]|nr:putative metal-binding motif-containing protein [Deltaproteobacteria bacterium]
MLSTRLSLLIGIVLTLGACRKPEEEQVVADSDGDGFNALEDCDDADASVYPGAEELCNGVDDNCSGAVDEYATDASDWYLDSDGDGYGSARQVLASCGQPAGYVANAEDCNDGDVAYHPGAAETDCEDPADRDLGQEQASSHRKRR